MTQKVALVTGGSRGIGEAICHSLAADGYRVIVASRNQEKVDAVANAIKEKGGQAEGLVLDICEIAGFKDKIKAITDAHGGLHVLVNNAGVTADNLMARIKESAFDSVIDTNLKGAFFLTQSALKPMIRQRSGRIINISSVVGLMGNPGQTNYAASKAGIIGMTKSLAKEVGSRTITCNVVAPGYVETEMTDNLNEKTKEGFLKQVPCGRMGRPEDVAAAVSFLAGDGACYITGQVLCVDGGLYM